MSDKRRLIYFDIRGRAEPIRLLLEEVGADYTDHYAEAEWLQRGKAESPFGVLPILRARLAADPRKPGHPAPSRPRARPLRRQ